MTEAEFLLILLHNVLHRSHYKRHNWCMPQDEGVIVLQNLIRANATRTEIVHFGLKNA